MDYLCLIHQGEIYRGLIHSRYENIIHGTIYPPIFGEIKSVIEYNILHVPWYLFIFFGMQINI